MRLKEMSSIELSIELEKRKRKFNSYRVEGAHVPDMKVQELNKYEAIVKEKSEAIIRERALASAKNKIEPIVEASLEVKPQAIVETKLESKAKTKSKKKGLRGLFKQKADAAPVNKEVKEIDKTEQVKEENLKPDSSASEKSQPEKGAVEPNKTYNTRMKEGYFGNRRR